MPDKPKAFEFEPVIHEKKQRDLVYQVDMYKGELERANRLVAHLRDTLMDIENRWQKAVTRAHTLQLRNNYLEKKIKEYTNANK